MKISDKLLVLIPARGGSKGIPQKNIRPLADKPLIAYTIDAAQQSACIERIIVTTDDSQIAGIARQWGAECPFLRPPHLAQDDTPGIAPVIHAIKWLEEHQSYRPDYVVLLQPTSPLRESQDITAAYQLALKNNADAVVSVSAAENHPYWTKTLNQDGRLKNFLDTDEQYQCRQDLPAVYALNGAIYIVRRDVLLAEETFLPEKTYGYVMQPERSLDIDTQWDFHLAELIMKSHLNEY